MVERPVATRSRALDALFLFSLAGGVVIYVIMYGQPFVARLLSPPLFATGLVLMVVLWFRLSWERTCGPGYRLLSWVFAVLVFVGTMDAFGAGALCALAVANLVFVQGTAAGAAYVALMVAGNLLSSFSDGSLAAVELGLLLYVAIFYAAVCVTSEVVRRSRDDKRRTESLLWQLEQAHTELSVRAERIRELTVAAERTRFARDMHDSVGHHLTAIGLTLRTAQRMPADRADEAWRSVERARELSGHALEETRRTVRALRPSSLGLVPLDVGLESVLQTFRGAERQVELTVEGDCAGMDADVEAVVYRAAQEAMTNVARHSDARSVRVRLTVGGHVELSVHDDGTPHPEVTGGCGLVGMAERATGLGGTLDAGPADGGFRLRLRVPASPGDRR